MYNPDQITRIAWNDAEKMAHIYTTSPPTIRKLDRMCMEHPDVYQYHGYVAEHGRHYTVYKGFVRFGRPHYE